MFQRELRIECRFLGQKRPSVLFYWWLYSPCLPTPRQKRQSSAAFRSTLRSLLGGCALLEDTRHVLKPPGRAAAGSQRLLIQGGCNPSHAVAVLAQIADLCQHHLLPRVLLDVPPVGAQAISEPDIPNPLAVGALVPQRVAGALPDGFALPLGNRKCAVRIYQSQGAAFLRQQATRDLRRYEEEGTGRRFQERRQEWRPKGRPENVLVHDFPDDGIGKAIPYGVYDMARDEAWVNVGAITIRPGSPSRRYERWWKKMGQCSYPEAKQLFITADAGGSNGYRSRAWKVELQALADETRSVHSREPLPSGHEQVEQDRASTLLPHHAELARQTTSDVGNRRRADRPHEHNDRTSSQSPTRQEALSDRHSDQQCRNVRIGAACRPIPWRLEL